MLDKLLVMFIYVNTLFPKVVLGSIAINKIAFAIIMLFFIGHSVHSGLRVSWRLIGYVFTSFSMLLILGAISLALGNRFEDLSEFISSLFILFLIPIFSALLWRNSIEKYLTHVVIAGLILAFYTVSVYVYFSQFPTWNPLAYVVNETKALGTIVTYYQNGLRVSVVMAGWVCVAAILVYSQALRKPRLLNMCSLALLVLALLVMQSLGLWLATFAGVVIVTISLITFNLRKVILLLAALSLLSAFTALSLNDVIGNSEEHSFGRSKETSLSQKSEQANQALAIFQANLLLGKGLGYRYTSSSFPSLSGESSVFLEVTYPMILSSTGFVGSIFYSFVFLFYVFVFLAGSTKTNVGWLLFSCYASILIAAIGNPFLWGGGLGLFLLTMLAALVETPLGSRQKQMDGELCALE